MQIYDNKLFKNPIKIIKAFDLSEFIHAFELIELFSKTHYLLGYVRYEAKDLFLGRTIKSQAPLLYFEVFERFEEFTPNQTNLFYLNPKPTLNFDAYRKAVERIKSEIVRGNTYEVNYTFDFNVLFDGNHYELYEYLLSKQCTPYNTFINNEYETVLSFSPELFFEIKGRHIVTKPMKGTIKRCEEDKKKDAALIEFLKTDNKNRAENVMIVDLLRNDLGRISKINSVAVTKLFEIETYPTFHAMTSSIEANLLDDITLLDVFKAAFPCGSVTGTPKISTMRITDEIEYGPRGIYCGAIGFLSPEKITFSVPIRILQSQTKGILKYRVGGAITWDSSVQDEWLEAFTKTRFLNSDFKIIETLKANAGDFDKHITRMKKSAEHYGFPFDADKIRKIKHDNGIIRISLDKTGCVEVKYKELKECKSNKVRISPIIVNSSDDFLRHKTTYRPYYNVDYEYFYDEIFFNEKGELTEGSRSNIVLKIDKRLYTPPVECGLLSGIFRQKLLDEGRCIEKILYEKDLHAASSIYCVNSVRGMKIVVLV